jgi:hypothetical protein
LFRSYYLAWASAGSGYPLVTTATTYRQQASRAFAAEMICPAEYLSAEVRDEAGLTTDQIADIAEKFDCPFNVVRHQAENHGIALRGVY